MDLKMYRQICSKLCLLATVTIMMYSLLSCTLEKDNTAIPGGNLTGNWKTNLVSLTLTQSGNSISGSYNYKGGKIKGILSGNRLEYTWTQTDGKKGKGYFIISKDWQSIAGTYGYNDDDSGGGEWKGTKVGGPEVFSK